MCISFKQQFAYQYKLFGRMNFMEETYEKPHRESERENNKQSAKKLGSKVIINVSDTQYAVVKLVAKKLKWILNSDPIQAMNFDLCWTDNHIKQETFFKMNQHQRINHFPGMEILSRKNNLGKNLTCFRDKFPNQYDFFPQTWMLPNDWADLKLYHDSRRSGKAQTFIVKPQAGCQGRGIYLTRHIDKLKGEKYVVQRYSHKPFLIDGLKFDMRIYVLIAGINPFRIFVYDEGLARLATEPYLPPRSDNLENKFMHLTNYAINKNHPNFIFNQSLQDCDKGHKRSLSSVFKLIGEMGHNVDELKQRIDDIIIKTLITGYPTLSKIQETVHPQNYANDMCFQILGLDVMLDHNLKPMLLEINYTPSFTTDTPFDKHVKKNLISDAIALLGITDQWKNQSRKKRDSEIKQRLMTGKRKKPSLEEKIEAVQYFSRERDLYQSQHLGRFRKIFVKSEEQFQQYRKYYDFAEELYVQQNRLTGTVTNYSSYYFLPFMKVVKETKKKKQRRESSLYSSHPEEERKVCSMKSIDHQRLSSAKSITKRVIVTSNKNLPLEKKIDQKIDNINSLSNASNVYFQTAEIFVNSGIKDAFTKKKREITKGQ